MANRRFTAEIVVTSSDVLLENVVEVPPLPFEGAALLDSFERADEKPLSDGGKWAEDEADGENTGEVKESAWHATSGTSSAAYWTPTEFSEPSVAVELHHLGGTSHDLYLFAYGEPAHAGKGYFFYCEEEATAGKFKAALYRTTTALELVKGTGFTFAVGDRLGLTVKGGKITAWHKAGAGAWKAILEASDSTWTKGYAGVFAESGATWALRNFEAGSE